MKIYTKKELDKLIINCKDGIELKEYILNLQHQSEEKNKVIDEGIEFLKEFHNYENRFKWCEEDYIKTILKFEEILERGKNANSK